MTALHRRAFLLLSASFIGAPARGGELGATLDPVVADPAAAAPLVAPLARVRFFIAEAERMRAKAIATGDQAFGAVVVSGDTIIGWGPSRVVADRNPKAHAERVAIMDAQLRLAAVDLGDAVLFSTGKPCPMCEDAAAVAGLARIYWGPDAIDGGAPRRR